MDKFKKWNKKLIRDWKSEMSPDAKAFYREFKEYLKREFPGAVLTGFKPGHYDMSGFLMINGQTVYIYHSLRRDNCCTWVDFSDGSYVRGVMYRTAKSNKDFYGGRNQFSSIFELADNIRRLITADAYSITTAA